MPNTKEFVTPLGHKVILKSFLSYNDLQGSLKIEDITEKSEKIIDAAVISLDGITENVSKAIRDLPISEYKAISVEVTNIVNGNFTPEK